MIFIIYGTKVEGMFINNNEKYLKAKIFNQFVF